MQDHFNEFIKPLSDELDDLLDRYRLEYDQLDPVLTECNCGCGETLTPGNAIWGEDNQPYLSASHLNRKYMHERTLLMQEQEAEEDNFGKGYKPWRGRGRN